ncbi:MAG: hypothetical protein WBW94_11975, partial [Anaerolineales bacterium]
MNQSAHFVFLVGGIVNIVQINFFFFLHQEQIIRHLKRVIISIRESVNADDVTFLDLFIQTFKQPAVQ